MLILQKYTIQKKVITLHLRLHENLKMRQAMRTRTVIGHVIKIYNLHKRTPLHNANAGYGFFLQ